MSDKWVTIFDIDKCTGCCNCVLATMDEHVNNPHEGYSTGIELHGEQILDITCVERGSYPVIDVNYVLRTCQHCVDAPCAQKAPDVIEVRSDGIVRIRPEKAKGRRDVVEACPFGAVAWNSELDMPQIWTMDVHLLEQGWTESRASQACPTGALQTRRVDVAELEDMRRSGDYRSIDSDISINTNVLYRNSHSLEPLCLSGRVVHTVNAEQECLAGVSVSLVSGSDNTVLDVARTDDFGIFRFEGLVEAEGSARLVIEVSEKRRVEFETSIGPNKFVGVISAD
ncbi:4Fe-4S dicluster domain-containing protein [Tropicibacter sp. Alg240-R139]|uniref:4Fe-4S dicluster domain-containing protein n=1 Tax=Tropicibacter sp. Alg240-R139 TaxID=2305991 RepID=UPI0013DF82F6|nr:4Fe-4S dicluster domain-containing protein [Tropicibacter sp. Alg240-R139]